MFNTLKINSSNPDIDGNWFKDDVEDEIKNLFKDIKTDFNWIDWIFLHVFVDVESDNLWKILKLVASCEAITSISLDLGELGSCRIIKK